MAAQTTFEKLDLKVLKLCCVLCNMVWNFSKRFIILNMLNVKSTPFNKRYIIINKNIYLVWVDDK